METIHWLSAGSLFSDIIYIYIHIYIYYLAVELEDE